MLCSAESIPTAIVLGLESVAKARAEQDSWMRQTKLFQVFLSKQSRRFSSVFARSDEAEEASLRVLFCQSYCSTISWEEIASASYSCLIMPFISFPC